MRRTPGLGRHVTSALLAAAIGSASIPAMSESAQDEANRINAQYAELYKGGRYSEAIPVVELAVALTEKELGPKHPNTATSLTALANLYHLTGAYAKAEPLYERALEIALETLGLGHPNSVIALNNLGTLYDSMGVYAKAEALYVLALTVAEKAFGQEHAEMSTSLNNLAMLYLSMGAYVKAEALYTRALAIMEKSLGPDHQDTATGLNNLAALYDSMGSYAKAEPLHLRSLAIRERALGPEHPDTAASLNNLALLYSSIGAYAKAEPLYLRALAIMEKTLGPEHPSIAFGLNNLAGLRWAMGDLAKARPLLSRSRLIMETNASRLLHVGSEQRRHQYLGTLVRWIDYHVSFSLVDPTPASRAVGAAAVLQAKGRTLDATAESLTRLRQNLDDKGRALLGELTQITAQRAKLSLAGPGSTPIEAFRKRLGELSAEQERLEGGLSTRSSAFQQAIQPVTLERVQQAIPASDVLVEWIRFSPYNPKGRREERWGAARYAAYLITRDKPPVAVDLGEAVAIERAVAKLQNLLRSPGGETRSQEARALFDLLVRPLLGPLAQLQPNPARLLLSPDGALNLVPFAALVDDQGSYLGQRFELNYLTSGRDLLRLNVARSEPPRDGVTVVAAPNYGRNAADKAALQRGGLQTVRSMDFDRSGMRFEPLPGTAGEARLLKQLFKLDDAQVATGDAASEARVKRLQGPRILHIATHGFFLHDQPLPKQNAALGRGQVESAGIEGAPKAAGENALLRSGLALAGANARTSTHGEDGILTAAEAAHLDLQGTQLVVLSACETGSGEVANGEGVYGLRRALVLAGAQSQLVSLWKVSDAATERLMGEYYQRLARGEGRTQALRAAQQVMQGNPATAHPFYWAAFVPIGDWRAVQRR